MLYFAWFATDYCVTGVFATTARSPEIALALNQLLVPGGPSVALCGVEAYVDILSTPLSFYDLSVILQARGEVLLGWREDKVDDYRNYGQLALNPQDKTAKRVFETKDDLIVIRREDSPYTQHPSML